MDVSYLARVIGQKRAREMWMLCERYNAQQALAWGLCNVVVPLDKFDEEVEKSCLKLLDKTPNLPQVRQSFLRSGNRINTFPFDRTVARLYQS